MSEKAANTRITREIGNALGALQRDKPMIAQRCVDVVEYARILRYVLNVLDGWMDREGASYDEVARHIRHGRIELRCVGDRVIVVVP